MNYSPDPGGVFASDAHRRVAGHLPSEDEDGISVPALLVRMWPDAHTSFSEEVELQAVLEDLVTEGLAEKVRDRWTRTVKGDELLSAPLPNEPPPLKGEALKAAQEADKELEAVEETIIKEANAERVTALKQQLKEAEKNAG